MDKIKPDILSFLKLKLLAEVNKRIKIAPDNFQSGGVGYVGYDFSDMDKQYKLILYYDAEKNSLILEYEDLKDIVDYCEIKLCLEKGDIDTVIYDSLKKEAVLDWDKFHHTLAEKEFFKPINNQSAQIDLYNAEGDLIERFTTYKEINPLFNLPLEINSIRDLLVYLYHEYFIFSYKGEDYFLSETKTDITNNITIITYSVPT